VDFNGDVLGEAIASSASAIIDEANNDIASARRRWSKALALEVRIPEPYSIGHARRRASRGGAAGLGVDRPRGPDREAPRQGAVAAPARKAAKRRRAWQKRKLAHFLFEKQNS
jgi:hypothetical protein